MNASTDLKDSLIAPPSAALSTPVQNGAEIVLRVLQEQQVEVIFGYPGGAVLPIYDALFKQNGDPSRPRTPRAGGGACRGGLCALHRPGRRGAGDVAAPAPPMR